MPPCGTSRSSLSSCQRRRRCLIAPALGRPLNSSAAPDVRAPVVRGRWHFGGRFGPVDALPPHQLCGTAPWHRWGLRIYAGGMNEAIRPGPENPPQATGNPRLSVIVPTFNERDNVTTLFQRLGGALAGVPWAGGL